jgi:hypothetical protein
MPTQQIQIAAQTMDGRTVEYVPLSFPEKRTVGGNFPTSILNPGEEVWVLGDTKDRVCVVSRQRPVNGQTTDLMLVAPRFLF